jgi:hypothetical protein
MARQPQPQQPEEEIPSVLLQKWRGLKNTVGPERLGPDDLERAKNIDLDDAGQPRRRRGYQKKISGDCHSLFNSVEGRVYVVKDGTLGLVDPNYQFEPLLPGISEFPLSYVQIAADVYFSSATHSGKLVGGAVAAQWGAEEEPGRWLSPVVNPTPMLPQVRGKLLGKPPLATSLAYWNGRIYLASGRALWATELYLYDFVDKTKNYKFFESDIQVVGSVTDGIYVGTLDGIYFLSGEFNAMRRVTLSSYGAIPGSLVYVPAELVNPNVPDQATAASKNAVMFMTTSGLVVGLDGGELMNLTQDDYLFPSATNAAALFRRQDGVNQYIGVLDSGGTPVQGARFGDYAYAEVRRAGTWNDLSEGVVFGEILTAEIV